MMYPSKEMYKHCEERIAALNERIESGSGNEKDLEEINHFRTIQKAIEENSFWYKLADKIYAGESTSGYAVSLITTATAMVRTPIEDVDKAIYKDFVKEEE